MSLGKKRTRFQNYCRDKRQAQLLTADQGFREDFRFNNDKVLHFKHCLNYETVRETGSAEKKNSLGHFLLSLQAQSLNDLVRQDELLDLFVSCSLHSNMQVNKIFGPAFPQAKRS